MLYLLVNAIKDWMEANSSWAALLTLLLIVLLLGVFMGFIRWIEER
jgi:predicted PurR-regulated permease PerM